MLRRHFINVSYSEDIPRNQIWYKTSNGEKFEYQILIDYFITSLNGQPSTILKENYLINDGWWCLVFTNNIDYIGFSEIKEKVGPIFSGVFDIYETIETNILNVIEIKLPNISLIGTSTFHSCTGLQSITIPNTVTIIEESAFNNCQALINVTIPNSVTSIESTVFYDCIALTSITIPERVTNIGNSAFAYCSSLTSIAIPNSVTSIGDEAFNGCENLISIIFDGTKEQWEKIQLGGAWNHLVPATVVHCTDGDIEI